MTLVPGGGLMINLNYFAPNANDEAGTKEIRCVVSFKSR